MKANEKKHIERNIHQIVAPGDTFQTFRRDDGQQAAPFTVTNVTRDEIQGFMTLHAGKPGIPARFRVPQLTQRGGETRLDLECKLQPA